MAANQYRRDPKRIVISTIVLAAVLFVAVWLVWNAVGIVVDWLSGPTQRTTATAQSESTSTGPTSPTLDYSGFEAGNIIADDELYDSSTMTEAEIASFIEEWNEGCVAGADGTVCLADYTEDTVSYEADQYCEAYQGEEGEAAASIIYKAATACGVNPQALLVLMQKEQSLITASGGSLTSTRYDIALGFGCPDSTDCDSQYFGFANQVYYAARQFQIYKQEPEEYEIQAGQENYIAYGPDCSGSYVYVENLATAALYNYTPYQPDLLAYAGSEGTCSTAGNLNFYAFYNAWFG